MLQVTPSPRWALLALALAACGESALPSDTLWGFSIAVLGDLDGDGTPELAVSAPATTETRGDHARVEAGRVCVLSGATGEARGCWTGATGRAWLGYSMTTLRGPGGASRLVTCAPFESTREAAFVGACHLVEPGALLDTATVTGLVEGEAFGGTAIALHDLDDDGWQELAVVSPSWGAQEGGNLGRLTVFSGSGALFSVEGVTPGEGFGLGVAPSPDATGDGVPDVVVGAPLAWPGGALHVLSGVDGAWVRTCEGPDGALLGYGAVAAVVGTGETATPVVVTGQDAETIVAVDPVTCEVTHTWAGLRGPDGVDEPRLSLHGAGDVDGDGVPDVAAAMSCDSPSCSGGLVFLLSGATFTLIRELSGPDTFGSTVRPFADWTGDGIAELLVGVPTGESGRVLIVDPVTGGTVRAMGLDAGWEE
ncbi:MAG: hypothetical protein AMXMBFR64_06820 [Myxococcales bacterium]